MLKNSDNTQENCAFVLVQLLLFDNAITLYLCANRKAWQYVNLSRNSEAIFCINTLMYCHKKETRDTPATITITI